MQVDVKFEYVNSKHLIRCLTSLSFLQVHVLYVHVMCVEKYFCHFTSACYIVFACIPYVQKMQNNCHFEGESPHPPLKCFQLAPLFISPPTSTVILCMSPLKMTIIPIPEAINIVQWPLKIIVLQRDIESTFGKTREAIAKIHRTHLCKGYCKNIYKESSNFC